MTLETIADRYSVQRRVGVGGMGDVWLADDELLGRQVAMKFVSDDELHRNPGAERALEDEAKTGGRLLGHPGVVSVLDLLHVDSALNTGPAIVMEYVDGCNLADWIITHQKRLDRDARCQVSSFIALAITEAIHDAHDKGVIHRDIKPQNILCSLEGRIKVSDFGLARVVEEITRSHTVWHKRTALYSAPEQWQNERPDKRTDIYQLCATLYELYCGTPANTGRNLTEIIDWHTNHEPMPLTKHAPGLDKGVADIVLEGLSKDPDARPGSWGIFDAVTKSIWPSVKFAVNTAGLSDASRGKVATLTDFDEEILKERDSFNFHMPNSLEALRESIGVILLGGTCKLENGAPKKAAPKKTAAKKAAAKKAAAKKAAAKKAAPPEP